MVSSQPERPQLLCRASPRGCRGGWQRTGGNAFPFGVEKPGAKPAGAPRTPSHGADSPSLSRLRLGAPWVQGAALRADNVWSRPLSCSKGISFYLKEMELLFFLVSVCLSNSFRNWKHQNQVGDSNVQPQCQQPIRHQGTL